MLPRDCSSFSEHPCVISPPIPKLSTATPIRLSIIDKTFYQQDIIQTIVNDLLYYYLADFDIYEKCSDQNYCLPICYTRISF